MNTLYWYRVFFNPSFTPIDYCKMTSINVH